MNQCWWRYHRGSVGDNAKNSILGIGKITSVLVTFSGFLYYRSSRSPGKESTHNWWKPNGIVHLENVRLVLERRHRTWWSSSHVQRHYKDQSGWNAWQHQGTSGIKCIFVAFLHSSTGVHGCAKHCTLASFCRYITIKGFKQVFQSAALYKLQQ